MKKTEEQTTEVQGTEVETNGVKSIQMTRSMLEDLTEERKSIILRIMEQSEPGTTGKMIWQIAIMVEKQQKLSI